MGGGGGGGDDGVEYQRQQEQARQDRIRQGMARIDELFNGKDVVTGATGRIAPNAATGIANGRYYDAAGNPLDLSLGSNLRWTGTVSPTAAPSAAKLQLRIGDRGATWVDAPDTLYTGKGGTGTAIKTGTGNIPNGRLYDANGRSYDLSHGAQLNSRWSGTAGPYVSPEAARMQYNNNGAWSDLPTELYTGQTMAHQGGFDDAVFQKRAQAYQDYAMPQVEDQYKQQQKALTFALARGGNLGSSLASNKSAELDKDYGLQRQNVIDTGQDYVNQGKADLATQKANAVTLLNATADPDAAYSVAQTASQQLSAMPSFSPLQPVVKNVAAGLGTYLANSADAEAIAKARANQPYSLSANWKGSGRVGG